MPSKPQLLWDDFKTYLVEAIHATEPTSFQDAWKSCDNRTKFYFYNLLPKVAKSLDFGFQVERPFRIDCVFTKSGGQHNDVPIIYIESENYVTTSHEEVFKLCCVNAPLKVLFVCTAWDDPSWKEKVAYGHWHYIVEDFMEQSSLTGYFAFIIAAWDETLKFHAYVLDEKAELIEDRLLLELNM